MYVVIYSYSSTSGVKNMSTTDVSCFMISLTFLFHFPNWSLIVYLKKTDFPAISFEHQNGVSLHLKTERNKSTVQGRVPIFEAVLECAAVFRN